MCGGVGDTQMGPEVSPLLSCSFFPRGGKMRHPGRSKVMEAKKLSSPTVKWQPQGCFIH